MKNNSISILLRLFQEVEDQVERRFYSEPEFPHGNQRDEEWFQERIAELCKLRRQLLKAGCHPSRCDYSWLLSGCVAADYWEEMLYASR